MTGFQGSFDAGQFTPNQGGTAHPVGKFPFTITHTECQQTKDMEGGNFMVEFTSPAGMIKKWYNLWPSKNGKDPQKTSDIAHGQLSALCHAIGIFKLDWNDEGAIIRGARGMMEVGYQKGEEPTADKPAGGYVEIKRVYDVNGNEPGKTPQMASPQPQQPQPAQGSWQPGPQVNGSAPPAKAAPPGWNAAPQQQATNQPPWAK